MNQVTERGCKCFNSIIQKLMNKLSNPLWLPKAQSGVELKESLAVSTIIIHSNYHFLHPTHNCEGTSDVLNNDYHDKIKLHLRCLPSWS